MADVVQVVKETMKNVHVVIIQSWAQLSLKEQLELMGNTTVCVTGAGGGS
jgi:hypothetical protein